MAMENPNETYGEKMDGLARWLGASVASVFFASLERCACVHVQTEGEDDDDEEEAQDRPLMLTIFHSFNSVDSISAAAVPNRNVNNTPSAAEYPPV